MNLGVSFSVRSAALLAMFSSVALLSAHAGVFKQITDVKYSSPGIPVLDDAGSAVWLWSNTNQLGGNPGFTYQLFRFDPLTGEGRQITSLRDGVDRAISVDDDGEWLTFASRGNLTGANHEEAEELFVMRTDGSEIAQLTDNPDPRAGDRIRQSVISGSGNRVFFISSADYLGSNPTHRMSIFALNRDGADFCQLTSGITAFSGSLFVSDDGNRVTFVSNSDPTGENSARRFQVFTILGDGTGLRQLTTSTDGDAWFDAFSGDGSTVAFSSTANPLGSNPSGCMELFTINWDGTGLAQLTGLSPESSCFGPLVDSLTDDGAFVFFDSYQTIPSNPDGSDEVFSVRRDGGELTQLTQTNFVPGSSYGIVSGSGSFFAFAMEGGGLPGQPNPDLDREWAVSSRNGAILHPLTVTRQDTVGNADMTPDASWVVFVSSADLMGANPTGVDQLFRSRLDGSQLSQVTGFAGSWNDFATIRAPSISDDGTTIAFEYDGDPFGANPYWLSQVFAIRADGSELRQLSPVGWEAHGPAISGNGARVTFESRADVPTGANPDSSFEIFVVSPDGSGLRMLTSGDEGYDSHQARLDATGTWVVFSSQANLDGGNPEHDWEVYRIRSDGSQLGAITAGSGDTSELPDVSATGDRIVFVSTTDPLGTNAGHLRALFEHEPETLTTRQLTTGSDYLRSPRISDDGSYVFFQASYSDWEPTEWHLFLYRVRADGSSASEPMSSPTGFVLSSGPCVSPASGGNLALVYGSGDITDSDPDRSGELYTADFTASPQIRVGGGSAPTRVTWDFEIGPIRYDVIRGNVENLRVVDGTIDLGTVYCVEDDSPDADTEGNDDPDMPAPGEAFFYLVRGSLGTSAGPGTWGQGSNGQERMAGVGFCQP